MNPERQERPDDHEHPKFEAFKQRALANPKVRAAYVEAKVRRKRGGVTDDGRRRWEKDEHHD